MKKPIDIMLYRCAGAYYQSEGKYRKVVGLINTGIISKLVKKCG